MRYDNDYTFSGSLDVVHSLRPELRYVQSWDDVEPILSEIGLTAEHDDFEWAKWQPLLINEDLSEIYVVQGSKPYELDSPVYRLKLKE